MTPSFISEWTGPLAATLTTAAFIPQVWQICRTRHTKDISLGMYAIFTAGVGLWLLYGLEIHSWPVIVANGVTFLLAGAVLLMKIRFG